MSIKPERKEQKLTLSSTTRAGNVTFTNVSEDLGLSGVRGDSFAWGDYNNDGFQDLLVKGGRLFRNSGPPEWHFTEVTGEVGLEGSGYAVWGDYNNDGYLDFYAAGHPYEYWDTLWMNQGPPDYTFINVTESAGNMNDGMPGLAAGWADYDRDGYIDLYVVNWRDDADIRYPDVLWHNNGNGTFSDVTVAAGVFEGDNPYAGMGVNWGDYNNDGWPDIHVSNYLVTPNYLYENNKDGTFTDVAFEKNAAGEAMGGQYFGHTAGSSWADYDHDGDLDMWVSNLAHTTDPRGFYTDYSQMLRNDGPSAGYSFTDVRDDTGIEKKPYMSEDELHFGIAWGDYDNDGDYDMFIPQIKNYVDYAYSFFFENNGDGTFTDVSDDVGVRVWDSDGACWADYNNDGYIDLITEGKYHYEGGKYEVRLFRNNGGSTNHWLEVELNASVSNLAAIGARISVTYNGITQMKEVEGGTSGHAYQHSLIQHFGFGNYHGPVDIRISWPSGEEGRVNSVLLDQKITVYENPDLIVSNITFSDPKPEEGDKVAIYATVVNIGHIKADYAEITFYDGDILSESIGMDTITNLKPGEQKIAQVVWDTKNEKGGHTIVASIGNCIPQEFDVSNNQANVDIEVKEPEEEPAVPPQPEINHPPVILEFNSEPSVLLPGESSELSVTAEDDDGDDLTYTYHASNGYISGKGATVYWQAPEEEGKYTVSVTIYDPKGANDSQNLQIEVVPNAPPIIKDFQPYPLKVDIDEQESIVFKVTVEDENGLGDIDSVRIDLSELGGGAAQRMYDDGTHGDSKSQDGTFSYEMPVTKRTEPGKKTLIITVKDKSGNEDEVEIEIHIEGHEEEEEEDGVYLLLPFIVMIIIAVAAVALVLIWSGERKRMGNY
ncbi:MAG: VCBS repeat-containing protein [Thermoplasmata archaeon]|nr:MAG: VCBS repeat-containing protein [Thermoplasmata archaeon]